jgi:hypothetical protein
MAPLPAILFKDQLCHHLSGTHPLGLTKNKRKLPRFGVGMYGDGRFSARKRYLPGRLKFRGRLRARTPKLAHRCLTCFVALVHARAHRLLDLYLFNPLVASSL